MNRFQRWFGNGAEGLLDLLITLFCVLLSLTIHEFSHGLMAYWRGDKTAKAMGRLSLNPTHHIDPIGALCLFVFGFGWAKPVIINSRNFKTKTLKLDIALTSLAGTLSNFILAFLSVFLMLTAVVLPIGNYEFLVFKIFQNLAITNLGLGLFNLIPIPPLDGSKILGAFLPAKLYYRFIQIERFGFIPLLILINLPFFSTFLNFLLNGVFNAFLNVSGAILGLF